jgi:DNA-binding CsgD family transcriptional regulator
MNDLQLRQWCVRRALENIHPTEPLAKIAEDIYAFVSQSKDVIPSLPERVVINDPEFMAKFDAAVNNEEEEVLDWKPEPLKEKERIVMTECLKRRSSGVKISGNSIAREIGMNQASASLYLRRLVDKDYVRRQGNLFTPIRALSGETLPPIVRRVPAGAAKGFDPLKVPMSEFMKEE